MEITNTEEEYGLIAKAFHWIIAVLIIGLLPMGLFMAGMDNSPLKFEVFALHKSFGLLVFFLGVARLVWRFVTPPPDHLESHKGWETKLAAAAHFWLYVCIIGMPLSGWLMSNAGEFPVPFFGFQMPSLIGKNEQLGDLFGEVHETLAYTLLFILALHAAGALKHHVIDKDETLQRMAFKKPGFLLPAIVVLVLGVSYGISGLMVAKEVLEPETEEEMPSAATPAANVQPMPSVADLPKDGWKIVPFQSKLQFTAMLYNAPFTGEFRDFSGMIIFNPDDLANAKTDIRINMKDVVTGDVDRDKNIVGTEWFDSENFPEARFVADKFEKGDDDSYVAIGNLMIRGKSMPLVIPFTLDVADRKAHMTAKVGLNRLDYGIGTGEWEDEATVGHDVEVSIDINAVQ